MKKNQTKKVLQNNKENEQKKIENVFYAKMINSKFIK